LEENATLAEGGTRKPLNDGTEKVYTVSVLNSWIKSILDNREELKGIKLKGEIFGFSNPKSGHWYFSLKDEDSQIRCAMFKGQNLRVNFRPEDGMSVVIKGDVSVYHARGEYQVVATEMRPEGEGALHKALQQLVELLEKEGLFAPEHKKPIPKYPRRVGVVTSPTSAAFRDMQEVALQRFPGIEIILSGAFVQGDDAAASMIAALDLLEEHHKKEPIDVAVIGRGGGSAEDLWCFNDKGLAQRIFEFPIPIVAGIGHEIDTTIADLVADLRAATPTAAFEAILPDWTAVFEQVGVMDLYLDKFIEAFLRELRDEVDMLVSVRAFLRPEEALTPKHQRLDELQVRLDRDFELELTKFKGRLEPLAASLKRLSPEATLERGATVNTKEEKKWKKK
jgi:exodeoxyribonuclease VII large subunit